MGFSDALQGAGGGALAGGSFGPAGALIGGGLGALGGLFGGGGRDPQQEEIRRQLMALAQGGGMGAAQAGQSDQRGRQISYLDQLQALSNGQGPSLAKELLKDSMTRAEASQGAAAGSGVSRGVGAGAAYRNAAGNMGALQGDAARTGAIARAQEQLGALSMYGQNIAGTRGQDEALGTFNVGEQNAMARARRMAQLQALSQASSTTSAGQRPSFGEQILAGGANAYGLLGGRNQNQGVPAGNSYTPGRNWWGGA